MPSKNNQKKAIDKNIADRFGKNALRYESYASLQQEIAKTLANCLPHETPNSILEIGSGTGLLSAHIIESYPNTPFTISDITPEMIAICMEKFHKYTNVKFAVLDGETMNNTERYDIIASSMAIHWFNDMLEAIKTIKNCLNKGGYFYYSTIGPNCFAEWKDALNQLDLNIGIRHIPDLPGIFHKETVTIDYKTPHNFLKSLSRIGAQTPHADYKPLTRRELLTAMAALEKNSQSNVTWEILYGKVTA